MLNCVIYIVDSHIINVLILPKFSLMVSVWCNNDILKNVKHLCKFPLHTFTLLRKTNKFHLFKNIQKLKYTLGKCPLCRDIISESPQVVSIMTFNQQNQMVLKWSLDTLSNREWQAKKIKWIIGNILFSRLRALL